MVHNNDQWQAVASTKWVP